MDNEFRPVYEKLYRSYRRPSEVLLRLRDESFRAARMVSESIEKVQGELANSNLPQLREDAKYFLLLNLVEMVYVPLREQQNPFGGRPRLEDLREGFQEDIRNIAYSAAQAAVEEGQAEISCHRVIDTLHNTWERLNSAVTRMWEKRLT
jgi:hypothetical protein